MKKIFKIIFSVIIISVTVFLFRTEFEQIFFDLQNKYFPCSKPITYSLGSFDEKFGISKEEFLKVVNTAEIIWEKSIDKKLFIYESNGAGALKINLIYDTRQEATQKLKDIGITVDDNRASFNSLKLKYDAMQSDYLKFKNAFESEIVLFKNRQKAYEEEVAYLNKNGGASKDIYNRLNKEKKYLDQKFLEINKLQAELNLKADDVNATVIVLNRLVSSLNIDVKKFNTIGDELGGEFEEGTYKENSTGKEIDIYQFNDEGKLARVLTHEFGHALGLQHIENPKAVMYRFNNGINETLMIEDILALKEYCDLPI
ncbi:MAG: matrixin family metalloprotease [Candidatus Paceibacterota bacterium]